MQHSLTHATPRTAPSGRDFRRDSTAFGRQQVLKWFALYSTNQNVREPAAAASGRAIQQQHRGGAAQACACNSFWARPLGRALASPAPRV